MTSAGILFTDSAHQQLYVLDSLTGSDTDALRTNSSAKTIELLPVVRSAGNPVSFPAALDVTWSGAVVTFESSMPIYRNARNPTGLWVLAEYPPAVTVTTDN